MVRDEWATMRDQRPSERVEGWLERLQDSLTSVDAGGGRQAAALGHWLDQGAARQEARRGRVAEAAPFVPAVVWYVLILAGGFVLVFVGCFADPSERRFAQGMYMGSVAATIASSLVLVYSLDRPYGDSGPSIQPTELSAAVADMQQTRELTSPSARLPCNSRGLPQPA